MTRIELGEMAAAATVAGRERGASVLNICLDIQQDPLAAPANERSLEPVAGGRFQPAPRRPDRLWLELNWLIFPVS